MAKGKAKLALQASEHNWGLTGPGDWEKTTWRIFTDGLCKISERFRPRAGASGRPKAAYQVALPPDVRGRLMELADFEWESEGDRVCDGTAWRFRRSPGDGLPEKTFQNDGKAGCIDGRAHLETLVEALRGVLRNAKRDYVEGLRKPALNGDAGAQFSLGAFYERERDAEEAAKWYASAAENGSREATVAAGRMYGLRLGISFEEDVLVEPEDVYDAVANAAGGWLIVDLAEDYAGKGYGVISEKLLLLAASQGNTYARYALGKAYDAGEYGASDPEKAAKWFLKAAEQGDARSQYEIADMYMEGRGVPESPEESSRWFLEAAKQDDSDVEEIVDAQHIVGWRYAHGLGFPRDMEQARFWYSMAAGHGRLSAMRELGRIRAEEEIPDIGSISDEDAELWFRAAEENASAAMAELGEKLLRGEGMPRNEEKGAEWLKAAGMTGGGAPEKSPSGLMIESISDRAEWDWGVIPDEPNTQFLFAPNVFGFGPDHPCSFADGTELLTSIQLDAGASPEDLLRQLRAIRSEADADLSDIAGLAPSASLEEVDQLLGRRGIADEAGLLESPWGTTNIYFETEDVLVQIESPEGKGYDFIASSRAAEPALLAMRDALDVALRLGSDFTSSLPQARPGGAEE